MGGYNVELGDNFVLSGDCICKLLKFFRFVIRNILDWSKSLKFISSEILLRFELESPIFFVFVHVCFRLSRAFRRCFCNLSLVGFLNHRGVFSGLFGVL